MTLHVVGGDEKHFQAMENYVIRRIEFLLVNI